MTTASNQSPPAPPPPDPGDPVPVFLTNGVLTSGGVGPGVVFVPPAEAARLVNSKYAVPGDQAPRGFS